MDEQAIRAAVEMVRRAAERGNDEGAHCTEDHLYRDFVEHVAATGSEELARLATIVLETRAIKFEHWYA